MNFAKKNICTNLGCPTKKLFAYLNHPIRSVTFNLVIYKYLYKRNEHNYVRDFHDTPKQKILFYIHEKM